LHVLLLLWGRPVHRPQRVPTDLQLLLQIVCFVPYYLPRILDGVLLSIVHLNLTG